MKRSLPSLKKVALILLGLVIATLLFLWQALPRILQSQAEKFVAEKTGHKLVMDRPEFNPFELALRLGKLALTDPAGKPLLSFDGLLVDISAASLTKRALVFDAIRLDNPAATVVEVAGGGLNWTPFIDALKSKEDKPEEKQGLPPLEIRNFVLAGGKIDYADQRGFGAGFVTRIEPLDLTLTDFSTLPDDDGRFKISARTSIGAQIDLAGEVQLNPLAVTGNFNLVDLQLAQLAPFVKGILPTPPEGVAGLSATYHLGNSGDTLDVKVEQMAAQVAGLRVMLKEAGPVASVEKIEVKNGSFQLASRALALDAVTVTGGKLALPGIEHSPQFGALTVEDIKVALTERNATVGKVRLADGRVQAIHQADGRIDLLEALKSLGGGKPAAEKAEQEAQPESHQESDHESASPWRYRVGLVEAANLGVVLREASVNPVLELALDNIAAQAEGVSNDLSAPLPVKLSFDVRSGGRFEGEGKVVPAAAAADVNFKLSDLALKLAQPFLAQKTTLTLADGKLSTQGHAIYNEKGPNVKGEFAVRDLRLMEPGAKKPLLSFKTFGTRALTLTQKEFDLGELRLIGLDTQLIIDKDKSINFKRVIKQPPGTETADKPGDKATDAPADKATEKLAEKPAEAAAAVAAKPKTPPPPPAFIINIDRLRFANGEMDFADHSLILPFGTRIHNLRGSIAGLTNRPGAAGQLELDGEVDDFGMARAVGQVDLFNPTEALDLRVQFRNVEMTSLTPYTAHFAGRKIDSGKLSLDLQYKIKQRQLQGDNQVIMDKLTLGERIESPTATSLPLDLAIAILQDADGRIDLGLPVAGSLDDPQFSYGSIIWKAITNVLTKIVTAPFRALGALFGGGGEKIESIAFEAGVPQLTPPEREKLTRIAEAMGKRPKLVLSVGGLFAEADRVALQDRQLRRAVLTQTGQKVSERGDPGPISTKQPKIQEALEALYKERVGASDLAALKEGFRSANPGQLEESVTGKMMSRLSGLLREKKTLSEGEVSQLKGADFYGVLFERLRAKETVTDDRLRTLAQTRGEGVVEVLKNAGVTAERIQLQAPDKAKDEEGAGGEVPLRLALEPAKG